MMPLQNRARDKRVLGEQLHEGASRGTEIAKTLQEKR